MNEQRQKIRREKLFLFMQLCREKLNKPCESVIQETMSPLQFYTLCAIREKEMTMTELAARMGLPRQHVTKLAGRLVELGFAARRTDAKDRRVIHIAATDKADKFLDKQVDANLDSILSRIYQLPANDAERLIKQMEDMVEILSKIP